MCRLGQCGDNMHYNTLHSLITAFTILVVCSVQPIHGGEQSTSNNSPKVVLYTNPSGGGRTFASVAKNYPNLAAVNFDDVAKSACVLGTWIFYGDTNYANFSHGVQVYFSKANGCITFDQLSEKVSSIRFAGSEKDFRLDFIDLFAGVFFTGLHLRSNKNTVANITATGLPGTASIIVSGTSPWTLYSQENYTGIAKCVYPTTKFYKNTLEFGLANPQSLKKGCVTANE